MNNRAFLRSSLSLSLIFFLIVAGCQKGDGSKHLTLAIVSGVEGDTLKEAAREYQQQTGVHIEVAEFPYANLFEKEMIDLNSASGAYDLIMMDDPWFPRFAKGNYLSDLAPFYQKRNLTVDDDFVPASIALGRHPYETGALYALPYVGNSQLFFYRKDLFEKHSLREPATWDEVLAAAKIISEREQTGAPGGGRLYG
ncbi:MAG TPA: extracellular solute-binding protein, partial [Blastocatellia bacterium]